MRQWTEHVRAGHELDEVDVRTVVAELIAPHGPDAEAADFLEALHFRGETPSEVAAFASAFLACAEPFPRPPGVGPALDVCGTGGDQLGLFNVSTTVMFVAAGAGAKVIKHGNRKVTSRSGGADVLETLGVPVELPVFRLKAMLEEAGAVFLFAPQFHPAFKNLAAARKILGARGSASIFNMLGPLLNPARPEYQICGVFSARLLDIYPEVLHALGCERSWVVHGSAPPHGVIDEVSVSGPTLVAETFGGTTKRRVIDPASMGIAVAGLEELRGGDAADNARIIQRLLAGELRGAPRDIVMVNAAAALIVAELAADWKEAVERAADSIDSGAAARVLSTMQRIAAVD